MCLLYYRHFQENIYLIGKEAGAGLEEGYQNNRASGN